VSGSGISWAVCKSAPRSRQITTPAPLSIYRPDALPATQPTASKHWRQNQGNKINAMLTFPIHGTHHYSQILWYNSNGNAQFLCKSSECCFQQLHCTCLRRRRDGIVASLKSWQQLTQMIHCRLHWRQIFKNMKDSPVMVNNPVLIQFLRSNITSLLW